MAMDMYRSVGVFAGSIRERVENCQTNPFKSPPRCGQVGAATAKICCINRTRALGPAGLHRIQKIRPWQDVEKVFLHRRFSTAC
jgi:hypothetical protein